MALTNQCLWKERYGSLKALNLGYLVDECKT